MVAVLMNFNFELLVIVDSVFSNVPTLLGVVAFVRLRFTQEHVSQAFAVPAGRLGAVAVALPQIAVIIFSFVSLGYSANLMVSLGCLVVVVAASLVWNR